MHIFMHYIFLVIYFFSAIIPRGENELGVSHCEIVREYIMALNKFLPHLKPENPLFYRGNEGSETKISKFVDQRIGQRYLKSVPREICEFLQLPNPEKFRSHSIRHSSACIAAQNGATAPQLMASIIFFTATYSATGHIGLFRKFWF